MATEAERREKEGDAGAGAGVPVDAVLYEGYHGTALFSAAESDLRNIAVTQLKTVGGTYPRATLRCSDMVTATFDVGL